MPTVRCSWLTRIGDLPGMYQVSTVCGHSAFGRSPLSTQTATRVTPGGGTGGGSASSGRRQVHGVGDAEEQRRGGVHADERRIALAVEIADPTTST